MKRYRFLNMALAPIGALALLAPLAASRQGPQLEIPLKRAIRKESAMSIRSGGSIFSEDSRQASGCGFRPIRRKPI